MTTIASAGKICDVTEGQPERLFCATVESSFLQTLGVRPALGGDFTPEDDTRGAPPVAIVSHEVWTRRFGADPAAIGRIIPGCFLDRGLMENLADLTSQM